MILTEKKTIEEILESSKNDKNIFLISCNGCPEAAETGGIKGLEELKTELAKAGKNIVGEAVIDTICNKLLVGMRLIRHTNALEKCDAAIVLSCGIGVQAIAEHYPNAWVVPGLNTSFLGLPTEQGVWAERCAACGDCILGLTGGICPIARCSKSLLNGPCGGSEAGHCEINPEVDCAWQLIYERLAEKDKLHVLLDLQPPKNWRSSRDGGPRKIVRQDLRLVEDEE